MIYSLFFTGGVLLAIGFVLLVLAGRQAAYVTVAGKLKVFAQNFHHTVKCLENLGIAVLCLDEGALGLQPLGLNETDDPLISPITVIAERNKFSTKCSPKGGIQEKSGSSELDNSTNKLILMEVREKEKINPPPFSGDGFPLAGKPNWITVIGPLLVMVKLKKLMRNNNTMLNVGQFLYRSGGPRVFSTNGDNSNNFKPVVYDNLELHKARILEENKNQCGIYRLTNITNNKTYIGSAIDIRKRLYVYYNTKLLARYNMVIYKAILKHGYANFSLEILEYCDPQNVIAREQYYFIILQPEYNILKIAGSVRGHKHTEEAILKIREHRVGCIHSEETKEKMRDAKKGKTLSEEIKYKMSVAKKGKPKIKGSGKPSKKIEVIDNKTNQTTTYDSMREAARALNIACSSISRYFKNNLHNPKPKPYNNRYSFTKV